MRKGLLSILSYISGMRKTNKQTNNPTPPTHTNSNFKTPEEDQRGATLARRVRSTLRSEDNMRYKEMAPTERSSPESVPWFSSPEVDMNLKKP